MDRTEVIFHNVARTYVPGTAVECRYCLQSRSKWSSKDWIGLFRVGWRSVGEYSTFAWSPAPQGHSDKSPHNCCVRFEASYLPAHGSTLYQFCYVNADATPRGSSPPFTFRDPEPGEDLVVLEEAESNLDMVVVVTRRSLLETQLAESERTREDLTKLQKETGLEVRELQRRVRELEAAEEGWQAERVQLRERCK
ncbi:calcium-binding and coiled-coil domain-containing protein 1-like, partial [Scyliorhinus torazame]|uniref:calcium-binding and coiled-coil domain-containing protein 1-like n=1 Tax=Scyliorhinus torazame TaxID=75743 RepID=UPI003B5C748F